MRKESKLNRWGLRWLNSWPFLLLTTLALMSTLSVAAAVSLFRIPNLPNCRAIFWPTASAAMRLQCAQSYAEQGSVENLLGAIKLVDALADDHPLRGEINNRIEAWANQILNLASSSFQQGDLDGAIATARQIPAQTTAAQQIEERIQQWQTIWSEAEGIFEQARKKLEAHDFQSAFSLSVQLLDVNNDYWSQTKYNQLTQLIAQARADSSKLAKAKSLAQQGGIDGYREAIELLRSIESDSVLYKEARKLLRQTARAMLDAAESYLQRQQLTDARSLLRAIPRNVGLNEEVADFQVFVDAYQRAWAGDALGLDGAINRLQSIGRDRPLYARAQALTQQWQDELRAVNQLETARAQAEAGGIANLRTAIATAEQVSRRNPRWDEVSGEIERWRTQAETLEDRPILAKADRLADPGQPDDLRAAIQEARKISSGRALFDEARSRIQGWTRRIQQIEDRPILERARQLAAIGNLSDAIATADQIGDGRALSDEAQDLSQTWRDQQLGQARLREALSVAEGGSTEALISAIGLAQQVPSGSPNSSSATTQIGRWSWELLSRAEAVSNRDLEEAIDIAERIPAQAEAFNAARLRLRDWRAQLEPAPLDEELNSSEAGE
ncbi:chromosome segregation ATPase [Romeria aff. gracilis LEGE 07310]|uniref:Chromosome segregation ATPase n=1 Tax=Vasconcelosia minhoensis LEGE 07310 TaxID=915328 RepID=A0A8J7DLV0_9CYAN|nr:chromosome segregation ATPase [Romeria gracilis]MBE9077751.1 chromosome segregation ATPase [Romeria aff. gracilis LEGE 07310]